MVQIGPLSDEPWPDKVPGYYQPGRYVCVRTKGWVPRLIQLATLSSYDHTFVIVSDRGDIVEAEPLGARKRNISEYAGCDAVINTDPMDAEQSAKVVDAALAMVGMPYNDLGFTEDGLEALTGHVFKWLLRRAEKSHGVICSQLAVRSGLAGGYDWTCGLDASEVTPGLLSRRPSTAKLVIG